jgi:aspartate/methionine/tyrosine aminotransferase
LRAGDDYFQDLVREQQACRDLLSAGLERVGFGVVPSQGTYFVTTDIRPLGYQEGDFAFCRHITEHAKVAAVPLSVFYAGDNASPPTNFVRFCFSKDPRVLNEAIARLEHALV